MYVVLQLGWVFDRIVVYVLRSGMRGMVELAPGTDAPTLRTRNVTAGT
jgi:hypothetical protein